MFTIRYIGSFFGINTNGNIVDSYVMDELCWDKIRINHYFSKSYDEFLAKRSRVRASLAEDIKRNMTDFHRHDFNDVEDSLILLYLNDLTLNLQK